MKRLFSKKKKKRERKKVDIPEKLERRLRNNGPLGNGTDENLTERIAKFKACIRNENIYCILLRSLADNGLVNQWVKLNLKIICTLGTKLSKLFETINSSTWTEPQDKIIFHAAPYI